MKFDKTFKLLMENINNVDECSICGGKIIERCRCASKIKHTKELLEKGHGRLCENGHRLGSDGIHIMDKDAVERHKQIKRDLKEGII